MKSPIRAILVILLLAGLDSFGQETKKVTNKISGVETEVYFCLKSDPSVKHGSYQLIKRKTVRVSGQYSANQKDGLWTEYHYTGKRVYSGHYEAGLKSGLWTYYRVIGDKEIPWHSGNMKGDMRVGVWHFFDGEGIVIQEFDFDSNVIKNIDEEKAAQRKLVFGGKYDGLIFVDEPPTYVDGDESMFKFLSSNLVYPPNARDKKIEGSVYVQAMVTLDGNLIEYSVVRGLSPEMDEEASRVLALTSGKWNPAVFNGEKVVSVLTMPFRFVTK